MARTTLDLKCIKCGVGFKKTLEDRRRTPVYKEGEMLQLVKACPNNCGGEWFSVQKRHSIRKFKRHF